MSASSATGWVVFHFASGQAYFSGLALVALAAALSFSRRAPVRSGFRVLALLGLVFVLLSSTPNPAVLWVVWVAVLLTWLIIEQRRRPRHRIATAARLAVIAMSVICAVLEAPYLRTGHVPALSRRTAVYVVGDSLSAGVAPEEKTWPQLFAERAGTQVFNVARGGADTSVARQQLQRIPPGPGIIIIEIGGNDLLRDCPAAQFESDLRQLLADGRRPGRHLVMLELPLLPLHGTYGAAQRRLAREFDVLLIPKHVLAAVLTSPGATLDGIHLSAAGHELLANSLWTELQPGFELP